MPITLHDETVQAELAKLRPPKDEKKTAHLEFIHSPDSTRQAKEACSIGKREADKG